MWLDGRIQKMSKKAILITGASSGMGKESAKALIQQAKNNGLKVGLASSSSNATETFSLITYRYEGHRCQWISTVCLSTRIPRSHAYVRQHVLFRHHCQVALSP